jgi:hypothetical protein
MMLYRHHSTVIAIVVAACYRHFIDFSVIDGLSYATDKHAPEQRLMQSSDGATKAAIALHTKAKLSISTVDT